MLAVIEDTRAAIKIVYVIRFVRKTENTAQKTKFLVGKWQTSFLNPF